MRQHKITIILTGLTVIAIALLLFSNLGSADEHTKAQENEQIYTQVKKSNKSVMTKENHVQWNGAVEQVPLTESMIYEKTEGFIDILLQEVDENYKLKNVTTKEDMFDEFEVVITREAVEPYVEFYYEEYKDGLYIAPTELPPWFIVGEPYETIQHSNCNVVVSQENEMGLHGKYKIEIEFSYLEDWRIVRIEHLPVEENQLDII